MLESFSFTKSPEEWLFTIGSYGGVRSKNFCYDPIQEFRAFPLLDLPFVALRNYSLLFVAMIALFDNYNREVGRSEYVPSRERSENWNFINTVINTKPMQLVYSFLSRKKIVCSVSDFRRKLYYIWFDLYNRRSSRKRYTRYILFLSSIC